MLINQACQIVKEVLSAVKVKVAVCIYNVALPKGYQYRETHVIRM